MTKKVLPGQADQATAAENSITDPNATMVLTEIQGRENACPLSEQPTQACVDTIRAIAHSKWEAAGCPAGNGVEFWLEAERELQGEHWA